MALTLLMILFTVTTNAAAQIILKTGMRSLGPLSVATDGLVSTVFSVLFNPWILGGLTVFAISMASHLAVLSRVDLSFAYPFLSLAYIMVAAYAFFVFGEDVGVIRMAGYALICAGTVLIAFS
ncbi:transporter [Mongoliimonas terrestris]|uniref:transporter n=1 Tax=Mongoliimonas terrestris TaxID=1709001 RepID=UPI0009496E98|nr:transporter [Mongoliimonas terrestris]